MSYLALLFTLLGNSAKGYCSKRLSGHIHSLRSNMGMNLVRSVLCCLISLLIVFCQTLSLKTDTVSLLLFLASGFCMALFQFLWLSVVNNNSYMLVSVFGVASFIVPCMGGLLLLDERLTYHRGFAIILICISIYFLCKYNGKIKQRLQWRSFLPLCGITLSQGCTQFLQKYYMSKSQTADTSLYTFYLFLFSAVFFSVWLVIFRKKKENPFCDFNRKTIIYILTMTVALFLATFCQTYAAKEIPAIIMYPVLNIMSIVIGTFMSVIFFKERLKKESVIGITFVGVAFLFYFL